MGFVSRLFGQRAIAQTPGPSDDYWYMPTGALTSAGMRITADTAMKLSAVWRCVSIISSSIAMLPLPMYQQRADGGKDRVTNHPLYDVLHDRPNQWQTSYEWREMMQQHLLLRGNAYSRIVPGPRGPVDQLVPLHPDAVTPRQRTNGAIVYEVRNASGQQETLLDTEVFHLRGLSDNGVTGLAVLDYAREAFGLGLAQESYATRFFSQSSVPPAVLEHPGKLSDQAHKHIEESWQASTAGIANLHRVKVLEEGMKLTQMSVGLTAEQAQLVEARETTIADIARWFGVPNHMIGETAKTTSWGSGIEQLSIGYVMYTLLPWCKRWEQRISHSLILAPQIFFAEFVLDSLLRGDAKSRAETLQVWRQNGIINADEWRTLENMNPVDPNVGNGSTYFMPANLTPIPPKASGMITIAPPAPQGPPTAPPAPTGAVLDARAVLETVAGRLNGHGGSHDGL